MEAPSTSTSTSTTVVTHHWQLEKYSRSRTVSSAPPPSDSAQPLAVEWDHYTQPRLALQLQAKYSNYPTASNAVVIPDQLLLQVTYDPLYRDRTPALRPLRRSCSTRSTSPASPTLDSHTRPPRANCPSKLSTETQSSDSDTSSLAPGPPPPSFVAYRPNSPQLQRGNAS